VVQPRLPGLFLSARRAGALAASLVGTLLLAGCAATDEGAGVQRFIDPRTAVTVQAMTEPWVYAREVRGLAVNQRDYRSVGIVEVNRQGTRAYYLGVVAWSTIDRSGLPAPTLPHGLHWAGEEAKIRDPVGTDLASAGLSEPPFTRPAGFLGEAYYRVSAAEARTFAQVPKWIELVEGDDVQRFELWKGSPSNAATMLERMP
jgi:hypothetical protein